MANNEQMTKKEMMDIVEKDVIQFLKEQAYKWREQEKSHARQANYVEAKSYADMEYAARVLALEIENEVRERALHYGDKKEV